MIILAIDTSGPAVGAAVSKDGEILAEMTANVGQKHSETILPIVQDILTVAGLSVSDVSIFACVAGPGSFTGVRIGVCCIKGLAHGAGKPCARLDSLTTLAAGQLGFDGIVCPILDARRGQVYCAAFRSGADNLPKQIMEARALPLESYLSQLPPDAKLLFTGDGVKAHGARILEILGDRAKLAPAHLGGLRAACACYLAERMPEAYLPGEALTPIYLRAPQAEREREARERNSVCRN